MVAPKGNRFWEARAKHGRDKIFTTPEAMWEAACEYFQWVEDNPLWEMKPFAYQGQVVQEPVAKMRAMTLEGLSMFIGVNSKYFAQFESELDLKTDIGQDYSNVITNIREVIKQQKFSGAAADLLNPNIIARDLGLKDQSSQEQTGPKGGPVEHKHTFTNPKEASDYYQAVVRGLPES